MIIEIFALIGVICIYYLISYISFHIIGYIIDGTIEKDLELNQYLIIFVFGYLIIILVPFFVIGKPIYRICGFNRRLNKIEKKLKIKSQWKPNY